MDKMNKLYVMTQAELDALFAYACTQMSEGKNDEEFSRKMKTLGCANAMIDKHISGEKPMNEDLIRHSRALFAELIGQSGQSRADFDYSFYNRVAVLIHAATMKMIDDVSKNNLMMKTMVRTVGSAICRTIHDHLEGKKEIPEEYLKQAERELKEKASPKQAEPDGNAEEQ